MPLPTASRLRWPAILPARPRTDRARARARRGRHRPPAAARLSSDPAGWSCARRATPTTCSKSAGAAMPNTSPDAPAGCAPRSSARRRRSTSRSWTASTRRVWADYEEIYAESWKPEEGDPALLRRFAEAEGAAGRIRLGVARHEGVAGRRAVLDGRRRHRLHPQARPSRKRQAAVPRNDADRRADRARHRPRPASDGSISAPATIPTSTTGWRNRARATGCNAWRARDPRNWPAIARARLRTLVSRDSRG